MQKEFNELTSKRTWVIVDAPIDTNIVGSRWTYQLKRDANRVITHYKAHLVAQGFTRTHGIDYDETFAPVTRFASTCVVLVLVATHNWEVHQLPSFVKTKHEGKVCRLYKALYGLKQGGRSWYLLICKAFAKFGYTCCQVKQCMFYKGTKHGIIIMVITVDDLTMASNCSSMLLGCKLDLQSEFEISDMGEIHWLLGVEKKRD